MRLLDLVGAAAVAAFMLIQVGPINAWLVDLGIEIHPLILPAILGLVLFGVLRKLRVFDNLAGLLSLAVAVVVAWAEWVPVNAWVRSFNLPPLYPAIAPVFIGLVAMVLVQSVAAPLLPAFKMRGRGLSTLPIWRRVIASAINLSLTIVTVLLGLGLVDWFNAATSDQAASQPSSHHLADTFSALGRIWQGGPAALPTLHFVGSLLLLIWVWAVFLDFTKWAVAWATRPVRQLANAMRTGLGGSARFLGYLDEWLMRWRPGLLVLGRSVYDGRLLGRNDDRHGIVVATTRSGKGRSFIIINLLRWLGSVFAIDPKGENAAVTARIRKRFLRQTVHILDPFETLRRLKLSAQWWRDMGEGGKPYQTARYNPLADLDLSAEDAVEQIQNVGLALITVAPGANPFWDNASGIVCAGTIAHVLVSDRVADADRHLGTVSDYINGVNGRDLGELSLPIPAGRPTLGFLAMKAARQLREASETAGSDIMVTLRVHMRWLSSETMRHHLSASDMSLRDLKHRSTSVYLVVPPEHLETHSCYLRVMATMGLREAGRGVKPRHRILFMLDEFAALGKLQVCATAASVTTGNGVLLVPVIQNLTQLTIYGQGWEVFLGNAGQQQVFATNDMTTAQYFTARLGSHMTWERRNGEWVPRSIAELRTPGELMRETSRASGQALVSFEGSEAMIVRRSNYDTWFGRYDPNPYETKSFKAKVRRLFLGQPLDMALLQGLWRGLRGFLAVMKPRSAY